MDPEDLKAYSVQGHNVLPSSRSSVVHRYNQILHPVGCHVADYDLFDSADVAQHCPDLKTTQYAGCIGYGSDDESNVDRT